MSFNPDGGVDIKNGGALVDYKAVFTGMVDATPLCWNPTREDLIRIKEIPDDKQDKITEQGPYSNCFQDNDGVSHTRLEFLCSINPNEILDEKDDQGELVTKYTDTHYFSVSFLIANKEEQSKSGNYRFINESLQHTWAPSLAAIQENPKMEWFDTGTARKAKIGEVQLYELLYSWYRKAGSKDSPILGFKLGEDPSETFEEIVAGDVSILNDMLDSDEPSFTHFSHDDGRIRKIAMLLGVQASDKVNNEGKPYYNQKVFVNRYVSTFAKEGRSLSKDAAQAVLDGKFKANTQGSLEFKVYDPIQTVNSTAGMNGSGAVDIYMGMIIPDGIEGDFSNLDDPSLLD